MQASICGCELDVKSYLTPGPNIGDHYKQWRQDVRKRDGNSCRRCGFDTNLEVHHIKPLVKYPEFATELHNGLTLCGNCHSLLRGREETTDLLRFIEESPYSRDEQIVEHLVAMLSKQLKALNDKSTDLRRSKAELLINSDEFTDPKHIQAEMLRLEAEEKLREAERLRREAEDAAKKRQRERQREAEAQQRHKAQEKLASTKQQPPSRDFRKSESARLSDNHASLQVKKRKKLAEPKNSHRTYLRQTDKASTRQRSSASGRQKYRHEVGRNRAKVKTAPQQRIGVTSLEKLELRAEQGDATAQLSLGIQYKHSRKNREAVKWFRKAAKQGNAAAQYNLGWMYAKGIGVVKDNRQAVKWYLEAAKQGNAAAQYNLGWMYAEGIGVARDKREAVKWYLEAAERGRTTLPSGTEY